VVELFFDKDDTVPMPFLNKIGLRFRCFAIDVQYENKANNVDCTYANVYLAPLGTQQKIHFDHNRGTPTGYDDSCWTEEEKIVLERVMKENE